MTNKKGVSPLVATVLLIGFSLAIAAMVITFSINKTKSTIADVEKTMVSSQYCNDVAFQVQPESCELVSGGVEGCNNLGAVTKVLKNVQIKNKGTFSIRKLKITSIGLEVPPFDDTIKPNARSTVGDIQVCIGDDTDGIVRFIPFVKDEKEQLIPCSQNQKEFDANEFCEG